MGDALALVGLVLVVSGCGWLLAMTVFRSAHPRGPAALRTDEAAQRRYYLLAREAVQELERLVVRDDLVPFLMPDERKSVEATVKKFNDL